MAVKIKNFEELLRKHIKNDSPLVAEKMCGSTPKSALMFYNTFKGGKYDLFNLTDLSKRYFERAKDMANRLGICQKDFKDFVDYHNGINANSLELKDYCPRLDAVVYWSGALNCFQPFDKAQEKAYRKMLAEETKHAKKKRLSVKEREVNMQNSFRKMRIKDTDSALTRLISDDFSTLKNDGIIISNHTRDSKSVKNILGKFLTPTDYTIEDRPYGFHRYELNITVWQNKLNP